VTDVTEKGRRNAERIPRARGGDKVRLDEERRGRLLGGERHLLPARRRVPGRRAGRVEETRKAAFSVPRVGKAAARHRACARASSPCALRATLPLSVLLLVGLD
jgi:hypothetical protein